jgi:hypothetical protein
MLDIVELGSAVRGIRVTRERKPRPVWLITSLLLLGLTVTVTLAPAAEAAAAYSPAVGRLDAVSVRSERGPGPGDR